jgi:hypothetical protein
MESKNLNKGLEANLPIEEKSSTNLNTVTPLSKYLAMLLFITMPFVGGWIGYNNAPEKVVEVERMVEIENIKTSTSSEEFSDLYTYKLPTGWHYSENEWREGEIEIVAPPPVEIGKSYIDKYGYFHDTGLGVYIQHFPATHIFDENKTFMQRIWPGEYGTLLSAVYRSDDEFGKAALSSLNFIFPATLFTTQNQRFKGISRINTFAQDYGFFARYELLLIDTLYGDMIVLSVELDGKEINDARSLLATLETDQGELEQAQQTFLSLLNSKSRDELSFGYLMDNLEDFANSLEGMGDRESYPLIDL